MNYIQTIERLKSLRLHGMADALENILSTKQSTNLNTEQMLEVLVQQEFDLRHSKRIDFYDTKQVFCIIMMGSYSS